MIKIIHTTIFILIAVSTWGQAEAWYIQEINRIYFHGQTEVSMEGGRADIINGEYAVEVEFARKWKEAIGQSLWYGLQMRRKPGIVIVMQTLQDRKYGIMLQSAIDYAGLTDMIRVWFYPEDFGRTFQTTTQAYTVQRQASISRLGKHSYNANSGIRHNSSCAVFNCKNCVPCGPDKGRACKRCGG